MTSAPARSWVVLGRLILCLPLRAPGALEPASASPPAHLPFDPHSPLLGQILLPRALSPASLVSWLSAQRVQRLHMFMAPGQTSGCKGRGCCVAHFPRKGTRASITPMGGFPVPRPPRLPACPSLAQAAATRLLRLLATQQGTRLWIWATAPRPGGMILPGSAVSAFRSEGPSDLSPASLAGLCSDQHGPECPYVTSGHQ